MGRDISVQDIGNVNDDMAISWFSLGHNNQRDYVMTKTLI